MYGNLIIFFKAIAATPGGYKSPACKTAGEYRRMFHAACKNGPSPLGSSRYFHEVNGLKCLLIRKNSVEAALSNSSQPGTFLVKIVTSESPKSTNFLYMLL